jgi:hypothetical protein
MCDARPGRVAKNLTCQLQNWGEGFDEGRGDAAVSLGQATAAGRF